MRDEKKKSYRASYFEPSCPTLCVNLLPALELRMSSRMSAEFRSSELPLELEFAHGGGIIGTSSAVIAMNRRLHIRSKVTVMRSPRLDSRTTPSPGAPGVPAKDRGNEASRNLDQQAGLIGSQNAQHQKRGWFPESRINAELKPGRIPRQTRARERCNPEATKWTHPG